MLISQLTGLLQPQTLSITNDSWKHKHHAPMRATGGGNGETRKFLVLCLQGGAGLCGSLTYTSPLSHRLLHPSCVRRVPGKGVGSPIAASLLPHSTCLDDHPAPPHDSLCLVRGAGPRFALHISQHEDCRRGREGGSAIACWSAHAASAQRFSLAR